MIITSSKNEKIKLINKLKIKNKRDKYGLFIIEGYREVLRAEIANIKFDSLYICPKLFLGENENNLIDKIKDKNVPIYEVEKDVFEKFSYRDRADGILAIASSFHHSLDDIEKIIKNKKNPFLVVLEKIEKPGNLGTILRSSDAAGVDAIIVTDPVTDIFNPNVVRASVGTLFTKPIAIQTNENVLNFLKKNKINILAATPHAKKVYFDENFDSSIAILVGAEQYGLTDFWMKNANVQVKIPMLGIADSLNVAAATIVLLYEAIRQRKTY
ncbi:MAG: RNA methyltransferase [Parachlamydiales bacterium]|nr:RNA methyltransferase [Parachlamydiales bacterium]